MDIEKEKDKDLYMSTENMFNNTHGISYHVGKFTGIIYKVHIEKHNIMHLYNFTKNMFINTHGKR